LIEQFLKSISFPLLSILVTFSLLLLFLILLQAFQDNHASVKWQNLLGESKFMQKTNFIHLCILPYGCPVVASAHELVRDRPRTELDAREEDGVAQHRRTVVRFNGGVGDRDASDRKRLHEEPVLKIKGIV
jgi:hypothetical protein